MIDFSQCTNNNTTKFEVSPNSGQELIRYIEETGKSLHNEWFGGRDRNVELEFERVLSEGGTPIDFYKTAEVYLYHLSHTEEDVWQQPYKKFLIENFAKDTKFLDFGCGIGSNGLALQRAGFTNVDFADLSGVCTEYLRWRQGWRNDAFPGRQYGFFYDLEQDIVRDYDTIFVLDVIEHLERPRETVEHLLEVGNTVVINFLRTIPLEADHSQLRVHYNVIDLYKELQQTCHTVREQESDWYYLAELTKK